MNYKLALLPLILLVSSSTAQEDEGALVTEKVFLDISVGEFAGRIEIGLFGSTSPKTVRNFIGLANHEVRLCMCLLMFGLFYWTLFFTKATFLYFNCVVGMLLHEWTLCVYFSRILTLQYVCIHCRYVSRMQTIEIPTLSLLLYIIKYVTAKAPWTSRCISLPSQQQCSLILFGSGRSDVNSLFYRLCLLQVLSQHKLNYRTYCS